MSDLDDLLRDNPAAIETAVTVVASVRKCRRHEWVNWMTSTDVGTRCERCGIERDPIKSRAGRTARRRGNDYERVLAQRLGGVKVGHHGGPEDVRTGLFNVQSKVGARFPGWMWDELAKLPRTDGRVPLLVVADSPGAGVRRRAVVVVGLDDWIALHGEATDAPHP